MPQVSGQLLAETHCVAISGCQEDSRRFVFQNSWGPDWGDKSFGRLSYEYFDKYVFECFGTFFPRHFESSRETASSGTIQGLWTCRDEWDRRIYCREILDSARNERLAWTFIVENDGVLEIEDLYVRPEFRSRGLGGRLAQLITSLADAKKCPLRLWLAFADCKSQVAPATYSTMLTIIRRLGLQFQRCPFPWAAALATNEKPGSDSPIEMDFFPNRPTLSLQTVLAAALALGTASPVDQLPLQTAVETRCSFDPVDWETMNRRRVQLINKKISTGLTLEETAEYQHLQSTSLELISQQFPQLAPDEERLRKLEARLSSEHTTPE